MERRIPSTGALRWGASVLLAALLAAAAVPEAVAATVRLQPVSPPQAPRVTADAAILMDWRTGAVVWEKNAYERRAPASTTKIMSGLLVAELGRPNDIVTVSRHAALTPGSTAGLKPGDRYTLDEILHGMLLHSGNDACVAAAEHLAGSEAEFVALMNAKAREIGALATNFVNPHGLTAVGHYSTAYDLAVMARFALRNPLFARVVATQERHIRPELDGVARDILLHNTNRLLWSFDGADGVKTGTTGAAGKCLVASATRDGRRLLAVVLHSSDRWGDAARLLAYGFEAFTTVEFARAGQVVRTVPVQGGMARRVALVAERDLVATVPKGSETELELRVEAVSRPVAGFATGAVLGRATILQGQRNLLTVNLVAGRDVPRRTLTRVILAWLAPLLRWQGRHGVGWVTGAAGARA
ncbi:MAG: D-alanyl-D-alanine carboxypeptidase family protein [Chloroflexota bacterium]